MDILKFVGSIIAGLLGAYLILSAIGWVASQFFSFNSDKIATKFEERLTEKNYQSLGAKLQFSAATRSSVRQIVKPCSSRSSLKQQDGSSAQIALPICKEALARVKAMSGTSDDYVRGAITALTYLVDGLETLNKAGNATDAQRWSDKIRSVEDAFASLNGFSSIYSDDAALYFILDQKYGQ